LDLGVGYEGIFMSIVGAIQMTSNANVADNIAMASALISQAARAGAKLIVLPENFALMGLQDRDRLQIAEAEGNGPIQNFLSQQARQHQITLIGGTIALRSDNSNKVYASCLVYDESGLQIARYDKIHLFDVNINQQEKHLESKTIVAGTEVVTVASACGKLGLTVCYDLRFPALFAALFAKGTEIITVPAAFTRVTGEAHWEVLLRARAIENFCFVIGACQSGQHDNGRQTYGHSMIVDPWGKVLARLPDRPGFVIAEIDLNYLADVRRRIPVGEHRRELK
jgi:deaminated glutathione amidase